MAFLAINPSYQDLLLRLGLTHAAQLVSLPGLIVSGHPDRHVVRVSLGGPGGVVAYLKREHRIRWRDRLASAWAGLGLVSRSVREAHTLAVLRQAGVGCPDWMAAGEDSQGRAFLLLRDLEGAVDLRQFLRDHLPRRICRRRFAHRLGQALARLHAAGFDHPDLYAKHVLVDPETQAIYFLDWQRSYRRPLPDWYCRVRDLAALDATLAEELAAPAERLACLRSYHQATILTPPRGRAESVSDRWFGPPVAYALGSSLKRLAGDVRKCAERLLRKPHVQKERSSPPPVAARGILWLDGEALCVAQDFWDELGGETPTWLPLPRGFPSRVGTTRTVVPLPGSRQGLLVRRSCVQPFSWLWSVLCRRTWLSPELQQAGRLFRRRKHGLEARRVLAFGQRHAWPWQTESFLLTEITGGEGRTER